MPVQPVTARLPSLDDVLAELHVVQVPLRVRFRGLDVREVALLRGPAGWGEFGAFTEYDDVEASWWLASAIEAAWTGWPQPLRRRVHVNATVPAVGADRVEDVLGGFDGCTTAKVKVAERGQGLADDVARVEQVRSVMGPDAAIRVDANGGWSVPQAIEALAELAPIGLQYAEQPCADLSALAALRLELRDRGIVVRIAADESIRKATDPFAAAASGAIDVAVLKVPTLGGVARTLAVAAVLAERHGVDVVVSSALDTSVGMAAGVAAAAALPSLDLACGLGTVGLLAADVSRIPLLPDGGTLPVGAVEADPVLLAELATPADRYAWWAERISRCHDVLVQRAAHQANDPVTQR